MEIKVFNKIPIFCKKYKFPILILLIGLVLMLLPGNKTEETSASPEQDSAVIQQPLEERLANILCQVEGAGNVKVILTISEGEKILFQVDENTNQAESQQSIQKDTVMISDSNHNETGLIKQIFPVVYQGAVVVCQGADNPSVRLEIVDAVSKLTGLGANCISVLKMK